ncbi:MAG: sigma factor, partial [Deltaproteobacteria bacterium]|nr:sigma factor [Deltaproteobacteria bacterium]
MPNVTLEARQRNNESWLAGLQSTDPSLQSSALVDLRDFIRRALGKSLGGRGLDDATLEDFSQEASMRVLEKIDTFRGESKFTTWDLSISLRVAFTELRRRRWKDVSL